MLGSLTAEHRVTSVENFFLQNWQAGEVSKVKTKTVMENKEDMKTVRHGIRVACMTALIEAARHEIHIIFRDVKLPEAAGKKPLEIT